MNIQLDEAIQDFVRQLVASGRYQSKSEVVRDGLRLLQDHELLRQKNIERVRNEIAIGDRSLRCEPRHEVDSREALQSFLKDVCQEARTEWQAKLPPNR